MYKCDQCEKSYKYRRNLKRHVTERHKLKEHWICVISGCDSTFIRRSYLFEHLVRKHCLSRPEAREFAIRATRIKERQQESFYEDISSSDDDIFDILAVEGEDKDGDRDVYISTFDTVNYGYEIPPRATSVNTDVIVDVNVTEDGNDDTCISTGEQSDANDILNCNASSVDGDVNSDVSEKGDVRNVIGMEDSVSTNEDDCAAKVGHTTRACQTTRSVTTAVMRAVMTEKEVTSVWHVMPISPKTVVTEAVLDVYHTIDESDGDLSESAVRTQAEDNDDSDDVIVLSSGEDETSLRNTNI